ncbi:TPA: hypothetical protein ACYHTU_002380 [Vibrio cholerae]
MITQGLISDKDDIQTKVFNNPTTGQIRTTGIINLLVSKPTQVITVKVSEDLWRESNNGQFFHSLIGKSIDYCLSPKDFSFAREDGQQVSGTNINLFKLPEVKDVK